MRFRVKWVAMAGLAMVIVWAAASVAYTPERTFELRTADGKPIVSAYIGYYHSTPIFNFVDSISRYHPGRLVSPDANGLVRIPARWGFKGPLDSQPELRVNFVYAPDLHNALLSGPEGGSTPGVVDIDAERRVLTLHDVTANPERWDMSLRTLHSAVRDMWPDGSEHHSRYIAATPADVEPLVRAVEQEYRALHQRHEHTPRSLPSEESIAWWPKDELEERMAKIKAQLEREPLWGPYLERMWAKDVANLKRDWDGLAR